MGFLKYYIEKKIFSELTKLCIKGAPAVIWGRVFADRNGDRAIVNSYEIDVNRSQNQGHVKPNSWMRMKRKKIKITRKLRKEYGYDIIWQFHTHPSGETELHEIDLNILHYLSVGVIIIVTDKDIVGWYYDKRKTKKPIIEKMTFKIVEDLIP